MRSKARKQFCVRPGIEAPEVIFLDYTERKIWGAVQEREIFVSPRTKQKSAILGTIPDENVPVSLLN